MPTNKKAVFAGCARDCSNAIQDVLQNISRMAELFEQSAFVFAENDSKDDTKLELQRWCKNRQNARVLSLDGLATAVHKFGSIAATLSRTLTSALGQKQTLALEKVMSALPPKADICSATTNVC
jgi:hypothetical protein